ncbi:MAG TPA: TldD/PmbA family protein [Candidatus Eremiobacteraceae bacterium]|nr:TldD/PmbA family protein [Candidatus Eremiobacteraceae bacterium]
MAVDFVVDQDAVQEALDRALHASKADETEALFMGSESALTRYTHNYIHESMVERNWQLSVRAVVGKRIGVASTNRLDAASVAEVVARAGEMARLAPEDHDFPGLPDDTSPCDDIPSTYDAATGSLAPDARADAVAQIVRVMRRHDLYAAGYVSSRSDTIAVANSKGVRRFFRGSDSAINIKAIGETSSGYAEGYARRFADLSPATLAETAARKAVDGAQPHVLEPGKYTVILEPPAFREFLVYLSWIAFGAQPFEQGSSFMSGKLGAQVMGTNVTIRDDFTQPLGLGIPFDFEGAPRWPVTLVENGVAQDVVYDSYYAAKLDHVNTGHALPAPNADGPLPLNVVIDPGARTRSDIIAGVEKGVLVSRTWYIRLVDQKQTVITGMTRDGLFLIQNGKIECGLKNMRFNESIVGALGRCELASELVRSEGHVLPAARIDDFHFTSGTEF